MKKALGILLTIIGLIVAFYLLVIEGHAGCF